MIKEGVSVLISTYNWPSALELSLLSLLDQTIPPNEIIVADDGSTKETKEMIDKVAEKTNIPIVHCWQPDEGFRLSLIRNKGLEASSYSYIIQIDGDIICHKNFVEDHLFYSDKGFFLGGKRCRINAADSEKTLKNKSFFISKESLKETKGHSKNRNKFIFSLLKPLFINKKINTGLRGCNMSYWLEDAMAINGYNTAIEGWGKEDNEFALRLNRYGIKKKTLKYGAIAYHLEHEMRNLDSLKKNEEILEQVVNSEDVVAKKGIKDL